MSRKKYPPFERVTAGRLKRGDEILIRDNADDRHPIAGQDEREFRNLRRIPTGVFVVRTINAYYRTNGRSRRSRYYLITFEQQDPVTGGFLELDVSSVQRFNRVIGET